MRDSVRADGDPTGRQSQDPHSQVRRALRRVPVVHLLKLKDPSAPRAERAQAAELVYEQVYRVAAAVLGRSSHLVEDVAQDAFESVCRNALSFEAPRARPGDATAWVNAIAARKAIDALRAMRSTERRYAPESLDSDAFVDSHDAPLDEAVAMSQLVEHLLASLDEPKLAVILLRYWGELTDEEIANALEQPLGTVKTWIRAALHHLGGIYRRYRPGESCDIPIPSARSRAKGIVADERSQARRPEGSEHDEGTPRGPVARVYNLKSR